MRMSEYQQRAFEFSRYPSENRLLYVTLGLVGESGEFADKLKKIYRDNGGELTGEKRHALKLELGDVLWYAAAIATELGYDLADVAGSNIAKLASRKERGTLAGSGDNR